MSNTNEGWFPDPMGRHQYRYWSGNAWTEHVSDNGYAGVDLLGPPAPPVATANYGAPATNPGYGTPMAQPVSQPYQPPATGQASAYPQGYVAPPLVAKSPIAIFALIGAVLAGLSTVLDWFDLTGIASSSAFDVPVKYLFDKGVAPEPGGITIGVVLALAAAAVAAISFVPKTPLRIIGRLLGSVITMCGVLFIIQTQRNVSSASGLSLTDVMGIGPWFAIVGGTLVGIGSKK